MKIQAFCFLILAAAIELEPCKAGPADPGSGSATSDAVSSDSFPSVNEVLQGRTFASKFERDVFFLRAIHDKYPAHWSALLGANLTVDDYLWAPDKLQRFIEQLGTAMAGANDLESSTNLALIASDPAFYANTNAYRPEILRAAARVLIGIGPNGRQALAATFNEDHYRRSPDTLEELGEVIGAAGVPDPKLALALGATAFTYATTNGGCYPHCTEQVTRNLLRLAPGAGIVGAHLNAAEFLDNPGRFQAVVGGIAAARTAGLTTNLLAMETVVNAKLATLTNSPGAYKDDLQELASRLRQAIGQLQAVRRTDAK